ncbi:hypothetical protein T459_19133 [Capsicum annuum]|uniref:Uncharacterized protein n=1 Tax=Capsicum annuum TaxID=4072 RepID=A0A2G2Z134_CAPAN|nr:hypothetical protein T459_19133 [Capsicum annuum]
MDKVDESEDEWSMCKKKPSLSKDAENRTSVRRATGSFKRYGDYNVDEWEDDTDDYAVFPLCYGHHIPSNTKSRGADVSPESKPKNIPKDVIKILGKLSACSSLPSWAPAKLNGEQCLGIPSKKKSPRANSTMDKVDNSEDEWNVCNEKSSLSNDGKKKQRIYEKDTENKRTSVRHAAASLKRYNHNYFVGVSSSSFEIRRSLCHNDERVYCFRRSTNSLTIQPWMQKDLASEIGFGIPSRASISSVKGDSRKDGIGRRVSRTNKIRVEKGELAKLDKIGMGIGTCIDVPDRLMLPGLHFEYFSLSAADNATLQRR